MYLLKRQSVGNKGMSGIGTLIIFIALILVAAVAAMVLLQTSASLQSRAIATGKESEEQASTALQITKILGHTDANRDYIDYLMAEVRLAPGSSNINLYETVMSFHNGDEYISGVKYNATIDGNNDVDSAVDISRDSNNSLGQSTKYSVYYLGEDADYSQGSKTGIVPGQDASVIYWTGNLGKNKRVEINFVPSVGAQTIVKFRTPVVLDANYVKLFP